MTTKIRRRKRISLLLACAWLCGTADHHSAIAQSRSGMSSRLATAASGFSVGAYLGNPDGGNAANEAIFEARYTSFRSALKVKPAYIDSYVDYTQPVSSWVANSSWQAWSNRQSALARSMVPVIAFPLASLAAGSATPESQFLAFSAGTYDDVIRGTVRAWNAHGFKTLFFRVGWEMNLPGNTFAGDTAQEQADWLGAYRHVYRIIHAEAAVLGLSAQVVWNPGVINYDLVKATASLYPGNDFVDVVGVDMYSDLHPFADYAGTSEYHDWHSGGTDYSIAQFIADPVNRMHYWSYPAANVWSSDSSDGHSQSFLSLLNFAENHGKPFAVCETGAGNSGNGTDVEDDQAFPKWLWLHLSNAMARGESVLFVNIWDNDGGGNYAFSETSDGKPLEAKAWGTFIGKTSDNAR